MERTTPSQETRPQEPREDTTDIGEFRKLGGFRQLDGPYEQFIIPEVPEKRKTTDSKFTIAFAVSLLVLLFFLIYTLWHADINRLIHGYDNCGNVCGSNNSKISYISCSGQDETDKPFLRLAVSEKQLLINGKDEYIPGECVKECSSDEIMLMNRCYSTSDDTDDKLDWSKIFEEVGEDLNKSVGRIVALSFIGLGFCIVMLLLFRYFGAVTIWVILIGTELACIALSGYLWLCVGPRTDDNKLTRRDAISETFAITFSVFSLILLILLVFLHRKIKLIIRLFGESMKIIFDMPLILLEPLLTVLSSLILLTVFSFLLLWLNTAGDLEPVGYPFWDYVPTSSMMFTMCLLAIITMWFAQFIIGCQQMIVAGAVSAHYFSKDKSTLTSPIYNSFYNLIRYHLGTVAFGSLIITVVMIIKALIRSLVNNKTLRSLILCCLGGIENLLKYLSKNAYIQTAMHGQGFYRSGKRAISLLLANAVSALAVNWVGDFISFMAKAFIVALTVFVGLALSDDSHPYWSVGIGIAATITAVLAHCFFTVFETAIDTLFLCYCEDQCMNDGMTRPYYMSANLMLYMEEAKKQIK